MERRIYKQYKKKKNSSTYIVWGAITPGKQCFLRKIEINGRLCELKFNTKIKGQLNIYFLL